MSKENDKTFRQRFAEMIGGTHERETPEARQKVSTEEKAEIEQLLTEGYTPNEIADIIGRPYKTVFSHISAVRRLRGGSVQQADPLRDTRTDLERIKLETLKSQLEHQQRIQELELRAKLAETELKSKMAELDYKAKIAELEADGVDDEEDDEGFNAEQMLVQILQGAFNRGSQGSPQGDPGPGGIQTPIRSNADGGASTEDAKDHIKRITGTSTTAQAKNEKVVPVVNMNKKNIAKLKAYIQAQGWNEEQTVAEAAKYGKTEEEARAFYREHIAEVPHG